ncbi:hypothetical protein AVEN_249133-1 [Araneus ventricosus]|uniref:Uncharacterized protein n=1 Tax=Araneus ventricosus TaxID=182803 RepID=A0A4Y2D5M1_ARAVE|nr:hypothetical protein AVEN_249133-1 [Araneus ventricosus]
MANDITPSHLRSDDDELMLRSNKRMKFCAPVSENSRNVFLTTHISPFPRPTDPTTPTDVVTTKYSTSKNPTTPTEVVTTKTIRTKDPTTPTNVVTTKAFTTEDRVTPTEEVATKTSITGGR